jgi:hypothetical protein
VDGDTADDIYTYNQILDFIDRDSLDIASDTEQMYRFRFISAHQAPLRTSGRDYNESTYNVLVEWEIGETTYMPLDDITKDDPMSCAEYAKAQLLVRQTWLETFPPSCKERQEGQTNGKSGQAQARRDPF